MNRGKRAVLLAILVWALAAAMGPACYAGQKAAAPAAPDLSALARRARPAVGVVVTFDVKGEPLSQGTAFFVRADGVGLTCQHVLSDAASALVRMENGASFSVKGRLAADPVRDLALFKVTGNNLPTVPLGDSSTLAPGQRVVAITAPEGLGNTVADGLVSAVRELPSGSMVQVTVPLSPGSSGGPIFDLSGRVVAVAAAVLTEGQALNFAIPINAAKSLLAQPGRLTPLAPAKQPANLEDWLRKHPTTSGQASAYDLFVQGFYANCDGRYSHAVEYLRAAVTLDPAVGLGVGQCCLGNTYFLLGRYQDAISCWEEGIRLYPDFAEAQYQLGLAYYMTSQWQKAADTLKQAIRLKPDNAEARCSLGLAYEKLGCEQEAVDSYRQAVRLKPELAEAHVFLGAACGRLGWHEEAMAAYRQAIRLKPDDARMHFLLGQTFGAVDRYQEEMVEFKEAIRLKPDFAEAHAGLGVAYLDLGDRGAALEEYRILKSLDAKMAAGLFGLIYP